MGQYWVVTYSLTKSIRLEVLEGADKVRFFRRNRYVTNQPWTEFDPAVDAEVNYKQVAMLGIKPGVVRMRTVYEYNTPPAYGGPVWPNVTVASPEQVVYVKADQALLVDNDRDGVISLPPFDPMLPYAGETSVFKPFRFWINDDNDSGDTEGDDIPSKEPENSPANGFPPKGANYTTLQNDDPISDPSLRDTGVVDGTRDLVDFFPVFLNIKDILNAYPAGTPLTCVLSHEDEAVNIVYTTLTRTTAMDYQTVPLTTGFEMACGTPGFLWHNNRVLQGLSR